MVETQTDSFRKTTPKALIELVLQVYEKHKGIYGYRRVTIYLNHFLNVKVNHKCIYRLMRLLNLKATIRRKRYTYKYHKPLHTLKISSIEHSRRNMNLWRSH